jgi:serine/threonine protein kinase/tetratricopeptide (TPR) repeat protein
MSAEDVTPQDADFTNLLEACDEALAARRPAPPLTEGAGPELKPRLERGLKCLERLQLLRSQHSLPPDWPQSPTHIPDSPSPAQPALLHQIGRFVAKRELGRGGFGIVYLAQDPVLKRDVALKVPHAPILLTPELRGRFRQEAQAAAALEHPNVVPVYEVGEIGPICYLVSCYCSGPTLADWLRQRTEPVPFSEAAALVRVLAGAVAHAHERGILHRDLKPANILLFTEDSASWQLAATQLAATHREATADPGAKGELPDRSSLATELSSFIPKITDFGLAKVAGTSTALTRSGAVLGTPSYMAPEQAAGKTAELGPAVDIYALGAMLYELLTGRPPFQGEGTQDTLQQVVWTEPVPPKRLRPKLPRDLQTICLKCLQKEPPARYVTAAALADDLGRFLEGKSIQARPVGPAVRLLRWSRRKPLVAGLLAALLVALVGGFAAVFWQRQRAEHNAADAQRVAGELKRERDRVLGEHERAERNLENVRRLVARFSRLGADLTYQPGMEPTVMAIHEEALAYYQHILQEKKSDPHARLGTALAFGRIASMSFLLRRWDKAIEAFRPNIELLEQLRSDSPQNPDYCFELVNSYYRLAGALRETKRKPEARAAYDRAIDVGGELLRQEPKSRRSRDVVAAALFASTTVLAPESESAEIERRGQRAALLRGDSLTVAAADQPFAQDLALGLENVGLFHLWGSRHTEAENVLRRVLKLRQDLCAKNSKERSLERYLAQSHSNLAQILVAAKRPAEAVPEYRAAVRLLDALVKDFPDAAHYRFPLAENLRAVCGLLNEPAQRPEVEELTHRFLGHYEKLTADFPKNSNYRQSLADGLFQFAGLLTEPSRLSEAEEVTYRALGHYQLLAGRQGWEFDLRRQAWSLFVLGQRQQANKNYPAAQKAYRKMLALNEQLVARPDREPRDRHRKAWDLSHLSAAYEGTGQLPEAVQYMRQSVDDFRQLAKDFPSQIDYATSLATREGELKRLLNKVGK